MDEDAITSLLAQVGAYLSLAGFFVQVGLTSRIHRSWGITAALMLLPVGLGAIGTLILLTGSLRAVAGARVLDGTLRYSLDKTTREVLFLPVPAGLRFRAKPFIDVTMEKFGKAFAAVLLLVLIRPWGLGLEWRTLSYASLVMTAPSGSRSRSWHGVSTCARSAPASGRAPSRLARSAPRSPIRRRSKRSSRSSRTPTSRPCCTRSKCSRRWTSAISSRRCSFSTSRRACGPERCGRWRCPARPPPADGCRPSRAWCRTRTWTSAPRHCARSPSSNTRTRRSSCAVT